MYQITYREIAAEEYANAIKWYEERIQAAAEGFIKAVDNKLDSISDNPGKYKNLFRNYHEVSTIDLPIP